MIDVDQVTLEKMVREGSDLSDLNLSGKSYPGAVLPGADFSGLNLKNINLEGALLTGANFNGALLEEANFRKAALQKADFKQAVLDKADFEEADLCGANLESEILDTCNLQKTDLTSANLFGASIIGTNLQGAALNNAFIKSAALNGAYLLEASLKKANLENADLSCAYMEKAVLEEANLQGATLINAYLRHASLRGSNLTGANLTGADLRNSRVVGCDLSEAVLEGAKTYLTNFTGLITRNTHFHCLDLSPEADGTRSFSYSGDWPDKHNELFESCFKDEEDNPITEKTEELPPSPATVTESLEPSPEPSVINGSEEIEIKPPSGPVLKEKETTPKQESEPPPLPQIPEFTEPVKSPAALKNVQILLYMRGPVGEALLAAFSFYLLKIRESPDLPDIKIDKLENHGASSSIMFSLDPTKESDAYISLFMILHFLKFSYEDDLKTLYERLKEAELVEEQSHHTDWPRIDLWALQLAKFPEISQEFTDSKSNLIKTEIVLSEDLSIKIGFDNGRTEEIRFSHGHRYTMTLDIENQLSQARGHCGDRALRELLYSLKRAVMETERMSIPDKEYACFSLSRFINEISGGEKELPIPAGCYWSRFWNEIKYIPEISTPAAGMKKYFPSISALMV